jgi:hypothetical protein
MISSEARNLLIFRILLKSSHPEINLTHTGTTLCHAS